MLSPLKYEGPFTTTPCKLCKGIGWRFSAMNATWMIVPEIIRETRINDYDVIKNGTATSTPTDP